MRYLLRSALVLLAVGLARPARAQAARAASVIVALTDTLSARDARALVLRDPMQAEDVVILRRSTATPEILNGALALVRRLRAARATPTSIEAASMQGSVTLGTVPAGRDAALQVVLDRIAAQPVTRIGNLGLGQWVRLASPTP